MSDDEKSDFGPRHPTDSEWDSELDQPMYYTKKGIVAGGPSCVGVSKETLVRKVPKSGRQEFAKGARREAGEKQQVEQPSTQPQRQSPKEKSARRVWLGRASVAQSEHSTEEELDDPFGGVGRGPVGWLEDVKDEDVDGEKDEASDFLGDVIQSDFWSTKHMKANANISCSDPQDLRQQPQPQNNRQPHHQIGNLGQQNPAAPQPHYSTNNMMDAIISFPASGQDESEVGLSEQDMKILQHTQSLRGVTPAIVEKCYNDLLSRAKARQNPRELIELMPTCHIGHQPGEGPSKQGSPAELASPSMLAPDNMDFGARGTRGEWDARERERQGTSHTHIPRSAQHCQQIIVSEQVIDQVPRGDKGYPAIKRGVQAVPRAYHSLHFESSPVNIPHASSLGSILSNQVETPCESIQPQSAEEMQFQASNSPPPLKKQGCPPQRRAEASIDTGTRERVVRKRKQRRPKSSAPTVERACEEAAEREPVKSVIGGSSLTGSMFHGTTRSEGTARLSGSSLTGSMFGGMRMGRAGALYPGYAAASALSTHIQVSQYTPSANLRSPPAASTHGSGPYQSNPSALVPSQSGSGLASLHSAHSPHGAGFDILNPQTVWTPTGITGKRLHEQMRGDINGQGRSGVLLTAEPAKKKVRRDKGKEEKNDGEEKAKERGGGAGVSGRRGGDQELLVSFH